MRVYKCKCGEVQFYGSGMLPAPCDPCEKCNTVPGGAEPVPHDYKIEMVETDEGDRPLSRCRWFIKTKSEIEKKTQKKIQEKVVETKVGTDKFNCPKNLDEALLVLDRILTPEDRDLVKNCKDPGEFHFTLGLYLRNAWGLWYYSDLAVWFRENYEIVHADDMSGIISLAYQARLLGRTFDIWPEVIRYHEFWKRQGLFEKMIRDFDSKKGRE